MAKWHSFPLLNYLVLNLGQPVWDKITLYPLAWKVIHEMKFLLCVCFSQFGLVFVIRVSFEKLNDAKQLSSFVNEVKGHIPRSRIICGQVSWKCNICIIFWKVKSSFSTKLKRGINPEFLKFIDRCNLWIFTMTKYTFLER